MKKLIEVIDEMIELTEAVSNASQVFAAIEKYLNVDQRTPKQRAALISLINKRMKKEKDVGMMVMNFARHLEQGNYLKPGIKTKTFKNAMEKSVYKIFF